VKKLAMTAIEFPPMQEGRELQPRCSEAKIAAAQAAVTK